MTPYKILLISGFIALLTLGAQGLPRKAKQNDDDDPVTPSAVGLNVAQIILGALTGNIDSIVKGSFGFIDDPSVNKLSHNAWDTLKGKSTETPPWFTTTKKPLPLPENSEDDPDSIRPQQPVQPVQPSPVQLTGTNSVSAQQTQVPADVYSQEGILAHPTSSPLKTTQPTYATLAPLSIIIENTTVSSEPDEEDTDEAEGENLAKGIDTERKAVKISKNA